MAIAFLDPLDLLTRMDQQNHGPRNHQGVPFYKASGRTFSGFRDLGKHRDQTQFPGVESTDAAQHPRWAPVRKPV